MHEIYFDHDAESIENISKLPIVNHDSTMPCYEDNAHSNIDGNLNDNPINKLSDHHSNNSINSNHSRKSYTKRVESKSSNSRHMYDVMQQNYHMAVPLEYNTTTSTTTSLDGNLKPVSNKYYADKSLWTEKQNQRNITQPIIIDDNLSVCSPISDDGTFMNSSRSRGFALPMFSVISSSPPVTKYDSIRISKKADSKNISDITIGGLLSLSPSKTDNNITLLSDRNGGPLSTGNVDTNEEGQMIGIDSYSYHSYSSVVGVRGGRSSTKNIYERLYTDAQLKQKRVENKIMLCKYKGFDRIRLESDGDGAYSIRDSLGLSGRLDGDFGVNAARRQRSNSAPSRSSHKERTSITITSQGKAQWESDKKWVESRKKNIDAKISEKKALEDEIIESNCTFHPKLSTYAHFVGNRVLNNGIVTENIGKALYDQRTVSSQAKVVRKVHLDALTALHDDATSGSTKQMQQSTQSMQDFDARFSFAPTIPDRSNKLSKASRDRRKKRMHYVGISSNNSTTVLESQPQKIPMNTETSPSPSFSEHGGGEMAVGGGDMTNNKAIEFAAISEERLQIYLDDIGNNEHTLGRVCPITSQSASLFGGRSNINTNGKSTLTRKRSKSLNGLSGTRRGHFDVKDNRWGDTVLESSTKIGIGSIHHELYNERTLREKSMEKLKSDFNPKYQFQPDIGIAKNREVEPNKVDFVKRLSSYYEIQQDQKSNLQEAYYQKIVPAGITITEKQKNAFVDRILKTGEDYRMRQQQRDISRNKLLELQKNMRFVNLDYDRMIRRNRKDNLTEIFEVLLWSVEMVREGITSGVNNRYATHKHEGNKLMQRTAKILEENDDKDFKEIRHDMDRNKFNVSDRRNVVEREESLGSQISYLDCTKQICEASRMPSQTEDTQTHLSANFTTSSQLQHDVKMYGASNPHPEFTPTPPCSSSTSFESQFLGGKIVRLLDTNLCMTHLLTPQYIADATNLIITHMRPAMISKKEFISAYESLLESNILSDSVKAILSNTKSISSYVVEIDEVKQQTSEEIELKQHCTHSPSITKLARRINECQENPDKKSAHFQNRTKNDYNTPFHLIQYKYAHTYQTNKENLKKNYYQQEKTQNTFKPNLSTRSNVQMRHVKSYLCDIFAKRDSSCSENVRTKRTTTMRTCHRKDEVLDQDDYFAA